jgi:rubrerythrin
MSRTFYSENEENNLEESLNKYEYLIKFYSSKPPTLEEALIELFRNGGASVEEAKDIYEHLNIVCNEQIKKNWNKIYQMNKDITKKDALIISSYTYEAKPMYKKYSPYRLLNTNLVSSDRKNGLMSVEKYFFLLLRSLRKLNKVKKNNLFRCITCKVKLENDPNNDKYVPYKEGNEKTFWPFTSTSDNEKTSESFLENGKGTKYRIVGDNLWGYDITLFNVYGEEEILLEPEKKYMIEKVQKGDVIEVTCKVIDNPELLKIIRGLITVVCPICGNDTYDVTIGGLTGDALKEASKSGGLKKGMAVQLKCKECGFGSS